MEVGFTKAQSGNLPKIDSFMVVEFFKTIPVIPVQRYEEIKCKDPNLHQIHAAVNSQLREFTDNYSITFKMDFGTTQHNDFNWPFPKPVVGKPCEPPSPNASPPVRPPPVAPYCHCDAHSYSPRVEQYKQLLEKEQKLCEDYQQLRKQMVDVSNDILDHPCDDLDSKMLTMYQATYKKRSFPITDYRQIKAAAQSTAPIPMEGHRLGLLRCYKDPTNFTESPPTVRPNINPPGPVHTGVSPKSLQTWFTDFPGRTEYMDTYSATAKACQRSMQRYKEPMPSTRRREDDSCI